MGRIDLSKLMHEFYMREALKEAQKAFHKTEVPVGAVLVKNGEIIARGHNLRETLGSPLGHAELITLQRASKKLGAWRLLDCDLYVTLEPCVMCSGALVQARIARVIYGAKDAKGGGTESLYRILDDQRLNHQVDVISGVLEQDCSQLLRDFFKKRRQAKKLVKL